MTEIIHGHLSDGGFVPNEALGNILEQPNPYAYIDDLWFDGNELEVGPPVG